jgi:NAD(P)-dependent dehydrogenase (short-subunit alcohol dehydrogenase family)
MSKTWLITGASSGLGRLMTKRLLARGDRDVATVRREDSLADLQRKHCDRLVVVPVLDLTDTAGIRAVLASAFRQLGRIDASACPKWQKAAQALAQSLAEFTQNLQLALIQ